MNAISGKTSELEKYGIKDATTHWNLDGETLQKITLEKNMGRETQFLVCTCQSIVMAYLRKYRTL